MQVLLPWLQEKNPAPGASVTYIVFDILRRGDEDLTRLPLTERRKILASAVREGPHHVVLITSAEGQGEDYYRAAVALGLEGVMAKRKDRPYEPGVRSGAWLKVRSDRTCDCVIAGYTAGRGGRNLAFGPLCWGVRGGGPGPGR